MINVLAIRAVIPFKKVELANLRNGDPKDLKPLPENHAWYFVFTIRHPIRNPVLV